MITFGSAVKSAGPRLLPFLATALAVLILKPNEGVPSVNKVAVKCLPALCLCGFVLSYAVGRPKPRRRYSIPVLAGLAFSCIGDGFLVFQREYFEHGLVAFALAQAAYTFAFAARPLNLPVALVCFPAAGGVYAYLLPGLKDKMVWLCLLYMTLIFTMFWRAVSRIYTPEGTVPSWPRVCACVGALLFIISDFSIAVDKFRFEIPHREDIVMSTYLTAQLGIALSVVEMIPVRKNEAKKKKR